MAIIKYKSFIIKGCRILCDYKTADRRCMVTVNRGWNHIVCFINTTSHCSWKTGFGHKLYYFVISSLLDGNVHLCLKPFIIAFVISATHRYTDCWTHWHKQNLSSNCQKFYLWWNFSNTQHRKTVSISDNTVLAKR